MELEFALKINIDFSVFNNILPFSLNSNIKLIMKFM